MVHTIQRDGRQKHWYVKATDVDHIVTYRGDMTLLGREQPAGPVPQVPLQEDKERGSDAGVPLLKIKKSQAAVVTGNGIVKMIFHCSL